MLVEDDSKAIYDRLQIVSAGDKQKQLFLEQNILGTLVPGLQKMLILMESGQVQFHRSEKSCEETPIVHPIRWLAMYLMRNNPKYNCETSTH